MSKKPDSSDNASLKEYNEKRDFKKTTEPQGGDTASGAEQRFVIQEHDASNLHYDFRLEVDGVLKSWAVPKGPSTDPSVKRKAIRTEDHPTDYIDFEGTIPEDQYGGGTVIVWDGGLYKNLRSEKDDDQTSMTTSIEEGKIEVWLYGKKIRGGYALIQTGGKESDQWLLIKMKDEEADARRNPVSTEPESILSDLTIEEMREKMGENL